MDWEGFITNFIKKNTGIVEKIGAIIGAMALLNLNILTKTNIIPRFRAYSSRYTKKIYTYFFKEYFSSLNVNLEFK